MNRTVLAGSSEIHLRRTASQQESGGGSRSSLRLGRPVLDPQVVAKPTRVGWTVSDEPGSASLATCADTFERAIAWAFDPAFTP